jgi:hypothetical protein
MVSYPINVKRASYRGTNLKRQRETADHNRIAAELERYINDALKAQTEPVKVYGYYEIAQAAGYSEKIVRDMCFSIDGGSNGFTAIRSDLTYEQAMELNRKGES